MNYEPKPSPGRVLAPGLSIPIPDSRARVAVDVALATGLRISEILSLRIEQALLNGHCREIVRVRRKGGREQDIYFPKPLRVKLLEFILADRGESPTGWVFCRGVKGRRREDPYLPRIKMDRKTLWYLFRNAQVAAGINPTYRFHDLRHTAITRYYEQCHNLLWTQHFAGHANAQMTTRYAHVNQLEVWKVQEEMMKGVET